MQKSNMSNIKLVPNQKAVTIHKEPCDNACKENYYAKINLAAMAQAALDLDAGAFKLWIYFAKNQPGYQFALSKVDVQESFGVKKTQYDNAIKELKEKGYLTQDKGAYYGFYEVPVALKPDHSGREVVESKSSLPEKLTTELPEKLTTTLLDFTTRNIINTTKDITDGAPPQTLLSAAEPPPQQEEKIREFEIEAPGRKPAQIKYKEESKKLFKF